MSMLTNDLQEVAGDLNELLGMLGIGKPSTVATDNCNSSQAKRDEAAGELLMLGDVVGAAMDNFELETMGKKFKKLDTNAGYIGDIKDAVYKQVCKTRGRARLAALCGMFDSFGEIGQETMEKVVMSLDSITELPKGSITATFKDEKFCMDVAHTFTVYAYAILKLNWLADKINRKGMDECFEETDW